jgi:hypothetical protein
MFVLIYQTTRRHFSEGGLIFIITAMWTPKWELCNSGEIQSIQLDGNDDDGDDVGDDDNDNNNNDLV